MLWLRLTLALFRACGAKAVLTLSLARACGAKAVLRADGAKAVLDMLRSDRCCCLLSCAGSCGLSMIFSHDIMRSWMRDLS